MRLGDAQLFQHLVEQVGMRFAFGGIVTTGHCIYKPQHPHTLVVGLELIIFARGRNAEHTLLVLEAADQFRNTREWFGERHISSPIALALRLEQPFLLRVLDVRKEALEHVVPIHARARLQVRP